ncbi:MAG: hypothetical protein ABI867_03380 [Kofleriaceae bacterium]
MTRALALAIVLAPLIAYADDAPRPINEEPAPEPAPPAALPPTSELLERLEELEAKQLAMRKDVQDYAGTKSRVSELYPLLRFITVYIDVGAFVVGGNGAGIRSDFLHQQYPEYRNTVAGQWVFMGDPFSTMINTLGEPADTADSRDVKVDTVNSSGRASVIVNTLAMAIGREIGKGVSISALAHYLPRPGPDLLEVPFAHIDYRPFDIDLIIEAGKIDSVLGVEYRSQDAPRRIGITPSLICRYTCGRPFGVDARLVRGRLSASAALINGDNFEERFEPKTELKASRYPTAAGHLQWTLPVGQGLEVGVSGAVGPQDQQADTGVHQWHVGGDLKLRDLHGWDVVAEYVQGKQQGSTTGDPAVDRMHDVERAGCDLAQCLTYKGAYVLVDRRAPGSRFIPYARVDWRSAVHRSGKAGDEFVYESHSARATLGARFELTSKIVGKIEYNFNHELGVEQFPHDVLTTSIVVSTD